MKECEFINRISELLADSEPVTPDTKLIDLSGWDSVGKLCLVAIITDVLKSPFNIGKLKEFKTVQDIIEIVSDKFDK